MGEVISFQDELSFKTARSSGAGGQHVNKVETAVTVLWHVASTKYFDENQINLIQQKLKNRISAEGFLQITVSESRSQHKNKNTAIQKVTEIVNGSLIIPKARKKTKPSKAQIEKRIEAKKRISDKKENRRFKY